jgi:signal transduction histidine kinase
MNYVKVDDETTLIGLVVTDLPLTSKQAGKRRRSEPGSHVKQSEVKRVYEKLSSISSDIIIEFDRDRDRYIAELIKSDTLLGSVVDKLKGELGRTVGQSHDFLQLVKLIRGYAETLLNEKFPDLEPMAAAEQLPAEGAIFFSTELMLMKLDGFRFLAEPNVIYGDERQFSIHQYVTKYFRIYSWQARQKELDLMLTGSSYAKVYYNASAIGAVIQGLLDNLIKYAPAGSQGDIHFTESADGVQVDFVSLGPRIEASERDRIFLPGYRGAAARYIESGGLGLGLASAKLISDSLDLGLSVSQESSEADGFPGRFRTVFSVEFAKDDGSRTKGRHRR